MIFLYYASDTFASRAKVLTDSIKKYHPNDTIVHITPQDGPMGEYIPNMAKHRLEKALELLKTTNDDVLIIGADCEFFIRCPKFQYGDVVIVPHVKNPLKNREYMAEIYQTGHANADFIYFRNCNNSKVILDWMISVTEDGFKPGAFYEQTWLSSLPFLFNRVQINRNAGMNVGYWDINHVELEKGDGDSYFPYYVNGRPLIFFQYSGYVKGEPEKMSRHSKEQAKNDLVLEIYKNYDRRIDQ